MRPQDSSFFAKARQQAERLIEEPGMLRDLIDAVNKRIEEVRHADPRVDEAITYLQSFLRMMRAYIDGSYRELPLRTLLLIVAGFIYFISPIDLIPDFIPVLGWLDDVALLLWIFNQAKDEVAEFEKWEAERTIRVEDPDDIADRIRRNGGQ